MSPPKILIVDNDPAFAESCADFLEMSGYRVSKVFTLEDARRVLEEGAVHLAIIDLRMTNNRDKNDVSGLTLAKRSNPAVPKIILTSYQSWTTVREALGPGDEDPPPAVSFVAKQEGPEVLLQHTRRVFEKFIPLNWALDIRWRARDCVSLLKLVDPHLELESLAVRVEEFEDLFRLLFRRCEQVRFERLLWEAEGRAALSCFAFKQGKKPETMLVVCGLKPPIAEEARLFREYAPKAVGPTATLLHDATASTHYAANVYTLSGTQLEDLHPLEELYQTSPDHVFRSSLKNLFAHTLADWSEGRAVAADETTTRQFCYARLGLPEANLLPALLEERLRALSLVLPSIGVEITTLDRSLSIRINDVAHQYPDPICSLPHSLAFGHPVLTQHTPGLLTGANVLIDTNQRAWVTNCADSGLAPVLWSLAEVEALIRFDWVGGARPSWLYEMERQLVYGDFQRLQPSEVESTLRKPLRAVQVIRQIAHRTQKDSRPYHLALLLQVINRFASLVISPNMLALELVRPIHLLLALAMLCDRVGPGVKAVGDDILPTGPGSKGIRLDKASREVWVDGRKLSLRGHSYDLLCDFYDHRNQLRTRRELVEDVFGEKFDDTDISQVSRLNTAIHRLRKQIEADPEHPSYLLTEQRGGYRLALLPESENKGS